MLRLWPAISLLIRIKRDFSSSIKWIQWKEMAGQRRHLTTSIFHFLLDQKLYPRVSVYIAWRWFDYAMIFGIFYISKTVTFETSCFTFFGVNKTRKGLPPPDPFFFKSVKSTGYPISQYLVSSEVIVQWYMSQLGPGDTVKSSTLPFQFLIIF